MFILLGSGTLGNGPKMADIDNMVLPGEKKQLPKLQVKKIRTTSPVCGGGICSFFFNFSNCERQ